MILKCLLLQMMNEVVSAPITIDGCNISTCVCPIYILVLEEVR